MYSERWLYLLCLGRSGQSLIFSAYAGAIPMLVPAWHLSAAQAGAIQSAWHVGYLLSLFGAGFLADRFGAKATLINSSMVAAAAALAFALFADGFWSAFLLYGLAGLCSGGSYTPGLKLIFERTVPQRRGAAMGLFLASGSVGYALALAVMGAAIPHGAWRPALLLCAGGVAAGALLARHALRPLPAVTPQAHAAASPFAAMRAVIRNRPAMACIAAYSFHCWELLGMWAWLPAFLTAALASRGGNLDLGAYGLAIAALSHLASCVGSLAGGKASDRHGRVAVMLSMALASLACSFAFGWLYTAPLWLLTAAALAYNLFAIADSSVYSVALAEAVPPSQLGAAYSVRSVLGFGAGAISPWAFGLALDYGQARFGTGSAAWALAWSTVGLGALLGPAAIWGFARLSAARGARAIAQDAKNEAVQPLCK